MAEFGPVFAIFILILAFPILDLLSIALSYGCGAVLNYYSVREAALVHNDDPSQATTMATRVARVESQWQSMGLGHFVKVVSLNHTITITPRTPPTQLDDYVQVTQVLQASPFLTLPFPLQVTGINAPMSFTYSSQRMIENAT